MLTRFFLLPDSDSDRADSPPLPDELGISSDDEGSMANAECLCQVCKTLRNYRKGVFLLHQYAPYNLLMIEFYIK